MAKIMTTAVAFSLLQLSALADTTISAPNSSVKTVLVGRLLLHGEGEALINGNGAVSGTSVLSGSQVWTSGRTSATVQLGALGVLEISPSTSLNVTFDAGRVDVKIAAGDALLATSEGVKGFVTTPDGKTFPSASACGEGGRTLPAVTTPDGKASSSATSRQTGSKCVPLRNVQPIGGLSLPGWQTFAIAFSPFAATLFTVPTGNSDNVFPTQGNVVILSPSFR